jgi:hypothetical protein
VGNEKLCKETKGKNNTQYCKMEKDREQNKRRIMVRRKREYVRYYEREKEKYTKKDRPLGTQKYTKRDEREKE